MAWLQPLEQYGSIEIVQDADDPVPVEGAEHVAGPPLIAVMSKDLEHDLLLRSLSEYQD